MVGIPEFVAEISGSTEKYDLHEKKDLYLRTGVQEYLNWSVLDERILLFGWTSEGYREISRDAEGLLKSRILPGLWFDPDAMIRSDSFRVMEVLHQGLQLPEHQDFVRELKKRQAGEGGQT